MTRSRSALLAAFLITLALSGCGSEDTGKNFETVGELRDAVEATGVDCDSKEEKQVIAYQATTLLCGRYISLTVFEDPEDAQSSFEEDLTGGTNSIDIEYLVGENWKIVDAGLEFDPSHIPAIKESLGGSSTLIEGVE